MSALLHEVLQPHFPPPDNLAERLNRVKLSQPLSPVKGPISPGGRSPSPTSDQEELIAVQSTAVSPRILSRASSRAGSRSHSPTRTGAPARRLAPLRLIPEERSPTTLTARKLDSRDPLKAFPTDISQRIFSYLSIKELARCARVSRKWAKSQTINYVWFQHYRKENFHDASLPPGKWTRRESRQNWRTTYIDGRRRAEKEESLPSGGGYYLSSTRSGTTSGWQTPREVREERWRTEAEATTPTKSDMREMYKELGGRKPKTKSKYQTSNSSRDKGGWSSTLDE